MNRMISRACSARPLLWIVSCLLSFAPLASGCASMTSIEDAVPAAALQQPAEVEAVDTGTEAAAFAPPGERDAAAAEVAIQPSASQGERPAYPNLNVRPRSAAPVFTDAEQRRETSELRDIRRARQSARGDGITPMTPEEMRRLAERRTDETIRRIEGD